MKNILDKTAEFFGKKSNPTADELADLKAACAARLAEIDKRQTQIMRVEKERATETGDAATLQAVIDEETALKTEELALRARQTRLHKDLNNRRAEDAVRDAAKNRTRINSAVGDIEAMEQQLADAKQSLQRQINTLEQHKTIAGHPPELDLDPQLAERVAYAFHGRSNLNQIYHERAALVRKLAPQRRQAQAPAQSAAKGALA